MKGILMFFSQRALKKGFDFKKLLTERIPEITPVKIPEELIVPLNPVENGKALCRKAQGDKVQEGEIIGYEDADFSFPVNSPTEGTIGEIIELKYPDKEVYGIKIKPDGKNNPDKHENKKIEKISDSPETLEKILFSSGVFSSLRRYAEKKGDHIALNNKDAEKVIINGITTEPFKLYFSELIAENGIKEFLDGLNTLKLLYKKAEIYVCVSSFEKNFLESFGEYEKSFPWLKILVFKPKTPQENEEILMDSLVKSGIVKEQHPVVIKPEWVVNIYDAVHREKPVLHKIVSVKGPGCKSEKIFKVRIGTPVNALIKEVTGPDAKVQICVNSILTGNYLDNMSLPVDKYTDALIVLPDMSETELLPFLRPGMREYSYSNAYISSFFPSPRLQIDMNVKGDERACIYCCSCQYVCPRDLYPHLLHHSVEHGLYEDLTRYKIHDCVDCGLCSFVCPSKISLWESIKTGKLKLEEIELDESPSD